jgi:hypothetical protein
VTGAECAVQKRTLQTRVACAQNDFNDHDIVRIRK